MEMERDERSAAVNRLDDIDAELGLSESPLRRSRGFTGESTDSTQKDTGSVHLAEIESAEGHDMRGKVAPHREAAPDDDITSFQRRARIHLANGWDSFLHAHPRISKAVTYASGPSPPVVETSIKPFLWRTEVFFSRQLRPLHLVRHFLVPTFLLAWLLGFIFLVRSSYFNSSTSQGAPNWVGATDSFWDKDDSCGLNGTFCTPFSGSSLIFRCPAQTLDVKLLNNRAVGSQEVIYQPLVVGGLDDLMTYRADSWICPAAIQRGLFGNKVGGCGKLERIGEFTGFVGGTKNGVASVGFDSVFPSSYRFVEGVSQADCKDLRDDILGFNVAMSVVFSFIIRPEAAVFFWTLFLGGFWHVVLVSDPSATPPDIATGFKYFLPSIFVGLAFWRHSWRWVVSAFDGAIIERTIWYLGGFWVGLLINVTLAWIPIDRLTPHDIKQQPGGLVAVICLAIFLFLVILNQLRVIRRTGWLFFYLKWYIVGGVILGILCALPGLSFRLHHYIAAMVLMPGCAFVTRPSALFQGFLLGMFLDGAARWGFDSILQTPASLVGDGSTGSPLPVFITSATNFTIDQASIYWSSIPVDIAGSWDGFAVIVDDLKPFGVAQIAPNPSPPPTPAKQSGPDQIFRKTITFPNEILDQILENLIEPYNKKDPQTNVEALGSTSLVSKAWRAVSQRRMIGCAMDATSVSQIEGLLASPFFKEGLRAFVNILVLSWTGTPAPHEEKTVTLDHLLALFAELPKMQHLIIRPKSCPFLEHWNFDATLLSVGASLSNLTSLAFGSGVDAGHHITPTTMYTLVSSTPNLNELDFAAFEDDRPSTLPPLQLPLTKLSLIGKKSTSTILTFLTSTSIAGVRELTLCAQETRTTGGDVAKDLFTLLGPGLKRLETSVKFYETPGEFNQELRSCGSLEELKLGRVWGHVRGLGAGLRPEVMDIPSTVELVSVQSYKDAAYLMQDHGGFPDDLVVLEVLCQYWEGMEDAFEEVYGYCDATGIELIHDDSVDLDDPWAVE
ncbi:hypothetical protein P7C70_g1654, partial [Phenoliferia sp. Uapishka_3]